MENVKNVKSVQKSESWCLAIVISRLITGGKISHLKFCNDTPKKLIAILHQKIGKENLNWKVCASEIFLLKKSHVTKRHIDVIILFWKKYKHQLLRKMYMQQRLISKRVNQRAPKSRIKKRINKKHPTSIQDFQRTPEKHSSNSA